MLDPTKTYRTRDGSRSGIRVEKCPSGKFSRVLMDIDDDDGPIVWHPDGRWVCAREGNPFDLIEDEPQPTSSTPPFRYEDCPIGEDGRRRAVTANGYDVELIVGDIPGPACVVGIIRSLGCTMFWFADGSHPMFQGGCKSDEGEMRLLLPPPPKRVVWVNLYDIPKGIASNDADHYYSEEKANGHAKPNRLGNRAHRIEIDP